MSAEVSRRLHLWSGLIVLGTFVAGAAAGAGAMAWLRPGPRHGLGPVGLPPPIAALDLTAEQQRQIQVIFEKHRPDMEAVLKESFPKLRALQEKTDDEIRPLLTAAQAKKFDEMKAHMAKERDRGGRGFPFGPGGEPGGPGGPGGLGGPPAGAPPGPPPGDAPPAPGAGPSGSTSPAKQP